MKKIVTIAAAAAAFASSFAAPVFAQEAQSPWLVRVRAVHLSPENKSDPINGQGASDLITINSKTIPEVDISYFFTKNIAAELVLTYPQEQDVRLNGSKIGTFKHLPPSLLVQYHFMPDSAFSPYVGAGINYTRISSVNISGGLQLDNSSFGGALQIGADYKINKNWLINFDIKKVQISSDVKTAAGAKISSVKIDPWLIGVGVGYRF
ncbi:OmpW family protein [Herbaspirillum seropedicae]|uniref:Outer membrane W protein n=2 Tax=Herbaspirillum seropedicae TaxID=964 RepID=D8J1A7_HERSS|nr:OmpW family outer membrane protein [Herbaspirillum seropedicae]ADJ64676.1 outer membrane W protein [Herbaspirillum seropedicae SmR1]AKN66592.1 membrane protein [Herbaspirillum seropedicae]AON55420.1 outer membrane W protein [Herbaspirillum seropedicae]MDR6397246.1 outer membrane protein [Herbaspirillum seropedicae]NQE28417.1 membrane protein [Herbaspirillum seropedicae]